MIKKISFVIILTLCSPIFADKLIIQQTETVKNFQIEKFYFATMCSNIFLKNYKKKITYVPYYKGNLKKAILSVFSSFNENIFSKTLYNKGKIRDKIISKRYLILDTSYQIVNINKEKFYKFTIYSPLETRKNIFNKLLEQYKIEYNLGDIK